MVENLSQGRIYKGSNAEISVEVFPRYYVASAVTDIALNFYTIEKTTSIEFSGSSITMSGNVGTVVFQPVQLEALEDGVLRYVAEYYLNSVYTVTDNETRLYVKTPQPYIPIDYVSSENVGEIVEEKMDDYMDAETARTEATYQKLLTAGSGISINNNVISCTYSGGTGPQGPQGAKGDKGDTGAQGPQGEKGETGAQGPQGPAGSGATYTAGAGIDITSNVISCTYSGGTGPQGPQGAKGDKGDTGVQGPQGEKGETGAQGPQGPAGSGATYTAGYGISISGNVISCTISGGSTEQPSNIVYYTTIYSTILYPRDYEILCWGQARVTANTYDNKGVLGFDNRVTVVPARAYNTDTTYSGGTKLTSISIPASVYEIDDEAFRSCNNLFSVTCYSIAPPTLGSNVFPTGRTVLIYVPANSVEVYKIASGWSDYASYIYPIT